MSGRLPSVPLSERPVSPGHRAGSRQCDESRGRAWAGTQHVLLAVLGYHHDLERSIVTVAARHPVGVHDRYASRLFTCSWHGANLREAQFRGGHWDVVMATMTTLGGTSRSSGPSPWSGRTARYSRRGR